MDRLSPMQASPRLLQQVELFRDLGEDDLARIAARLEYRHARRGAVIFEAGDPPDALYIVEAGQVRLMAPGPGAPETRGPGTPFGEMSLLIDAAQTVRAVVSIDADLWVLARADFQELLTAYPALALNLSRSLARRLQDVQQQSSAPARREIPRLVGVVGAPDALDALAVSAARQSGYRALLLDVVDTGDENSTVDPSDPFADVVPGGEGVDRLAVAVELSGGDFGEVVSHLLRRYDQLLVRLPATPTAATRDALALLDAVVLLEPVPGHWVHDVGLPAAALWPLSVPGADAARIGRDRARLARRLTGRRIGVALSSGGAHGLAHIGFLRVLDSAGIPVDLLAGTSMGAIVGSAYAAGSRGADLYAIGREAGAFLQVSTAWRMLDFRLSRSGFLGGDRFERAIGRWTRQQRFEDLEIPFFTVAAEVIGGRPVVFHEGPVAHGVRASCSLPGLMLPVPHGDDFLIDGAAVDPVPCHVLAEAGADFIIACNVIPQVADRLYRKVNQRRDRPPSFLDVSHSESEIMAAAVARLNMQPFDVLVAPRVGKYHWREGRRLAQFVRLGEDAARAALPQIQALVQPRAHESEAVIP